MLAIGVFSQGRDVWSYLVHQNLALAGLGHVDHLLDDVVGVLVLHHDVKRGARAVRVGSANFFYQNSSLCSVGILGIK